MTQNRKMKMSKQFWMSGIVSFLVLSSCKNSVSTIKNESLETLENTQWQLADETGTKLPTLLIENGKVSGNASCNNYTAQLETNTERTFLVKNIATTRMACKKDTETRYLSMLKKATRYKATSKTLELYQNELLLLKFNRLQ